MGRYEKSFWCPWPESNQHSLRNSILSRARLPIPPQGLFPTSQTSERSRSRRNIAGGEGRSTRSCWANGARDAGSFHAARDCCALAGDANRFVVPALPPLPVVSLPKHCPVIAAASTAPHLHATTLSASGDDRDLRHPCKSRAGARQ